MLITPIKTPLIKPNDDLVKIITDNLKELPEKSILVIASKIFSTVENRFVEKKTGTREEKHDLVKQEAEYYTQPHSSKYNLMLTVKRNWIFINAGIDESNADGKYLLWPEDPQKSLNNLWHELRKFYKVKELGLCMSDSSSIPLNWGVIGRAIAYCGFNPLKNYIDSKDLFGRKMLMEQSNIAQSITAAATLEMGEGAESTPLALVEDIKDIEFQDHAPTQRELDKLKINLEDDAFAPILTNANWHKGGS
ncbi:MAG: coenzyme F420-0:L-glutamate ligase [Patescibacteria group bacterium]